MERGVSSANLALPARGSEFVAGSWLAPSVAIGKPLACSSLPSFSFPIVPSFATKESVAKKKAKARPSVTRGPILSWSTLAFPLLRVFLLAMVGVLAAAYGLWRYYAMPRPSMRAPTPMRAPPAPPNEIPIEIE